MLKRYAVFVALGLVTGLVNGTLGVGGGSFLVPVLVLWRRMEEHMAHGTSLAAIGAISAVSAAVYATNRFIDLPLALKVTAGGVIGGYLGARLMALLPAVWLRRIFGLFLAFAAIRMLWAVFM